MKPYATLSSLLIEKLTQHGVEHIFGVPGDYSLALHAALERSPIQVVNTCDEQGAGFAADGYARMRGMGVVCVTYGVGGLKLANTTAQAYAEESPVVVISGAPGPQESAHGELLHHRVKDFDTQLNIFREITAYATRLDAANACCELDRALTLAQEKSRPVYVEIPRDLVNQPCRPSQARPEAAAEESGELSQAIKESIAMIEAARHPVIVAGVETARRGLQPILERLLVRSGLPSASTPLSKSVISEVHPGYLGVYAGAMGNDSVRAAVESSDCILCLGVLMTDINSGFFTARLDAKRMIFSTSAGVQIGGKRFDGVRLRAFLNALASSMPNRPVDKLRPYARQARAIGRTVAANAQGTDPVTVATLFNEINRVLDRRTVVIADTGDAMFGAMDLVIPRAMGFLSPSYYASLGFAVPASIGVQLACPEVRPLVLVGDGAFQMTGLELSTVARYGLNPIVVVLNNGGYGTERPLLDGPYNDLWRWRYERFVDVLHAGIGYDVRTVAQLAHALRDATAQTEQFALLNVHLGEWDFSPVLRQLGRIASQKARAEPSPATASDAQRASRSGVRRPTESRAKR